MAAGQTTTLTFTIGNSAANPALTGLSFTDTLPAGLEVASPNGATGACIDPSGPGGSVRADPGSRTIELSDASLDPGAACTFSVDVKATTGGTKDNTTSPLAFTLRHQHRGSGERNRPGRVGLAARRRAARRRRRPSAPPRSARARRTTLTFRSPTRTRPTP